MIPVPDSRPRPACRILVVDDESLVRDAIRLLLKAEGHSVETAADGREALVKFSLEPFDVVITDYLMPDMRGDHLAAEIKRRAPSLPVILLTAHAKSLTSKDRSVPGVDWIVSKLVRIDALRGALEQAISGTTAVRAGHS